MRRTLRRGLLLAAAATLTATVLGPAPAQAADPAYKVLVFSKTAGFRHDSIPQGITAIQQLGAANNFTVTATEDANQFTTANLAQYKAVVFLSTTGDVLNATQQTAFESYINGGGGYVGIHAAADTEYGWPYYGTLVGAWFASHPAQQSAQIRVEDRAHAATAHLGQTWTRTDEWYNYQTNPRSTAKILANLNESSYSGGSMSGDHPITWCKKIGNGRSFYTGLGHTQASYSEAAFRSQLLGGIRYAAGWAKQDCRPETGYTAIYNGSTTGWSVAGSGSMTNSDATLTTVGGAGVYWYSARQYASYSLKLDWRLPGDDDSGVFVGFSSGATAGSTGYEVQLDATNVANGTTGSVWGAKGVDVAARDAALNPPGTWNTFELLVEGERLRIYLNGSLINDFTNADPNRSLTSGYIGLQLNGAADDVNYRNVRIKELGAPPSSQTVEGESFSSGSGVQVAGHAPASGGQTLGYIDNGDWAGYASVSTSGRNRFSARISSAGAGGTITIRSGSQTGTVLGTVAVPNTGGWETFQTVQTTITPGSGPLFLSFSGGSGSLFDVDTLTLSTS
jgi:type 1 glutamine amidotransferase